MRSSVYVFSSIGGACAALLLFSGLAHAQSDLQSQINDRNQKIQQIQQEITALQQELNATSKEKQTLQGAVKEFDLSIKKVGADISLTQTRISRTDLEIRRLAGSISTTGSKISNEQQGIAATLRAMAVQDDSSPAVGIMGTATLSNFFHEMATLGVLRDKLERHVNDLTEYKTNLEETKTATERKREELAAYKAELAGQQSALAAARAEKNDLLKETQNKESSYQQVIADKKAQEALFEKELQEFEAKLGLHADATSIPAASPGILQWPTPNPYVTQYFGNTSFATQNPQIYHNKGHNGIDLRAPIGTPIRAARGGTVLGTGNTDLVCSHASFGKWVFIRHDNGLSSVYAHLSVISVSEGQAVTTGQIIGYSGQSGYSVGPHLHFTVYATVGVRLVDNLPSKVCIGKNYYVPVADPTAYLNPLSYLPPYTR